MNKTKIKNKWTEENISYLKTAYLEGSPLKQIAAQLNRSVSAINKVLARHRLRTYNNIEYLTPLPCPIIQRSLQIRKKLVASVRKKNRRRVKCFLTDYREWVHFDRVVCWLKKEGVSVIKSSTDVYYEVNGYPKSKEQILLIANLKREQKKLPIFFVRDIKN